MSFRSVAALGGILSLALFPVAQAAPVGKIEPATGARISRMDPALDAVIAPGARIERVASGFVFNEGGVWNRGEMWFSDLRGNKIYSIAPNGRLTMRLDRAGGVESFDSRFYRGPNGMTLDKDGALLLAQHAGHRIVKLDDKMQATPVIEKFEGKHFSSPNDLTFAPDGSLWFTDPPYYYADPTNAKADPDKAPGKAQKTNNVYRYKDGKLTAVITDLPRPNGVTFSPDGKTLYVANTEPKAWVYKYDVKPDGTVANKKLFADWSNDRNAGAPDGIKTDAKGNVWAAGPGGIRILSPQGKVLGQIVLPEVAANLAFGGNDYKSLYIMAGTGVYRIHLAAAGTKPHYAR